MKTTETFPGTLVPEEERISFVKNITGRLLPGRVGQQETEKMKKLVRVEMDRLLRNPCERSDSIHLFKNDY